MTALEIPQDAVWRTTDEGTYLVLASMMTGQLVPHGQDVPSIGGFPFKVLHRWRPTMELSILWDDGMRVDGITVPTYPWHRFTSAIELFWIPLDKLDQLAEFVRQARR